MIELKSSLFLVVHEEFMQIQGGFNSLVQLLASQRLVEDVTGAKDIAPLIIGLLIALVYLLDVDLRSRVDGRASLKSGISLLDLPGDTEISNLELSC